jgi:hypothetical protein
VIDHEDLSSRKGKPSRSPELNGLPMLWIRTGGEDKIRARMIHSQVFIVGHPHHAGFVYRYTAGPFEASPQGWLSICELCCIIRPRGLPISSNSRNSAGRRHTSDSAIVSVGDEKVTGLRHRET